MFMREVTEKGPLTRYFAKGLTVDTVDGYLASVIGLHELLKVSASHPIVIHRSH